MINRISRTFRDLDISFDPHPFTKDLLVKKDTEAIRNAIFNLINTKPYDRPFHPEIGCQIHSLLFENFTPVTKAVAEKSVFDVLSKFEPRIDIVQVTVTQSVEDENEMIVSVMFLYDNTSEPITVTTSLTRVR
jgi:phage baseplate assembly protein W